MTLTTDTILGQTLVSTVTQTSKETQTTGLFETELQRQLIANLKSQKAEEESENAVATDAEVEAFKRKLASSDPSRFFQEYNFDKIEELIAKKKEELIEELGLGAGAQPPLVGEARKIALQTLETLLDDYKKELLEQFKAEEKIEQKAATLSEALQHV